MIRSAPSIMSTESCRSCRATAGSQPSLRRSAPGALDSQTAIAVRCDEGSRALGRGFLTGAIDENTEFASDDFRNTLPRLTYAEARKANLAFVELLREIAARKDATLAQIELGWILAQKPSIVPIPGTTKLQRLEENLGAANVRLTPDELHEIEDTQLHAQGERYPEDTQRMIDR
jgi:Aldo/keto reductase family